MVLSEYSIIFRERVGKEKKSICQLVLLIGKQRGLYGEVKTKNKYDQYGEH